MCVALLAEGVDRNHPGAVQGRSGHSRPPRGGRGSKFRRCCYRKPGSGVALLAEGVDRNSSDPQATETGIRRPPRGGRG